jgi:ribosomal protein S18 acetylase RimI-like enzyme
MEPLAFETPRLSAAAAGARAAELQSLVDRERDYFVRLERRAPAPDEVARLVAEADADPDRVVLSLAPRDGGPAVGLLDVALHQPEPGTAHVVLLLLASPERGRGHGREVVAALEAALAARGLEAVRASVLARNAPARAFWEAVGYAEVGRLAGGVTLYEKALPAPE